jgi:hypothetical protein
MNNNPMSTFPQVADLLRHLGNGYYPRQPLPQMNETFTPSDKHLLFRYEWRDDANREANTKVESTLSSQQRHLNYKYKAPKGTNVSGRTFGFTQDTSKMPFEPVLSGSGDITYSSRMSLSDRNQERLNILNRLSSSLDAIAKQVPSPQNQQLVEKQNLSIQGLPAIEILIASIKERVISGIIDGNVYRDLLDVIRFFNQTIFYYDNVFFITNLINTVESIIYKAVDVFNEKSSTENKKETSYAETFINALKRFNEFLKINRSAVGRDLQNRSMVSESASRNTLQSESKAVEIQAPAFVAPPVETGRPPILSIAVPTTQQEANIIADQLPYYSLEDLINWSGLISYNPKPPTTREKVLNGIKAKLLKFNGVKIKWTRPPEVEEVYEEDFEEA